MENLSVWPHKSYWWSGLFCISWWFLIFPFWHWRRTQIHPLNRYSNLLAAPAFPKPITFESLATLYHFAVFFALLLSLFQIFRYPHSQIALKLNHCLLHSYLQKRPMSSRYWLLLIHFEGCHCLTEVGCCPSSFLVFQIWISFFSNRCCSLLVLYTIWTAFQLKLPFLVWFSFLSFWLCFRCWTWLCLSTCASERLRGLLPLWGWTWCSRTS